MKKIEKLICGQPLSKIRKFYFENKLGQLLNEIQKNQALTQESLAELTIFLQEIKSQDENAVDMIKKAFPGSKIIDDDIAPPNVESLLNGVSDEEWREKAKLASNYIQSILDDTRKAIGSKMTIPKTFWLDTAVTFISYLDILEKDRIFKSQIYHAKITSIIDEYGISRRESEDRAKLTKEYFDYKYMIMLLDRINEFINLCKKKDADTKYNY